MNSLLDLRFVIGIFFLVVGILLLVYSFTTAATDAQAVNRWCGIVFGAFGFFMVLLSSRKDKSDEVLEDVPKEKRNVR